MNTTEKMINSIDTQSPARKKLVIFDFDGTLTHRDSFFTFPRQILGAAPIFWGLFRGIPAVLKWKLGKISSGEAKESIFKYLFKGKNKESLMKRTEEFNPYFRKDILEELEKYRDAGVEVWIISASPDVWINPIAEKLGVNALCTSTATDPSGLLTGRFSSPNCHGEEKLRRLIEVHPDFKDFEIIAYGDEPSGGDAAIKRIATKFVNVKEI